MARKLFFEFGLIASVVFVCVISQSYIGAQTLLPITPASAETPSLIDRTPLLSTPEGTEPPVNGQIAELHLSLPTKDVDPDIIQAFEKRYRIKVVVETYQSLNNFPPDQGIDVVIASDAYTVYLRDNARLAHIDVSQIPNFKKNVAKIFLSPAYDPGSLYSVPYLWGTVGILYRSGKLDHAITSWGDLLDPKLKRRVYLNDLSFYPFLLYLGKNPVYPTHQDLEAAKEIILAHKDNFAAIGRVTAQGGISGANGSFTTDGELGLSNGTFDVIMDTNDSPMLTGQSDDTSDLRFVIPNEGTLLWVDALSIPANASNKQLARKFINFLYDPQVAARLSKDTHLASPNQTAIDQGLIDKALLTNPNSYPPPELASRLYVPGDSSGDKLYESVWFGELLPALATPAP